MAMFLCRFEIGKDDKPEDVYRNLVSAFAQVLQKYAEMPMKDTVTYFSDVITTGQDTLPRQKIIGRWEVDRRSTVQNGVIVSENTG